MQPVFETPRLLLRPRTLAETELCLAMDREPGVTRYVSGPWDDPAAHRAFIEARTRGPYPSGMGYWTVRRRTDNTFLGWILLIPEDAVGPETEIGWRLMPSVWGHNVAAEAALPVLRHAIQALRLPRAIADIDQRNTASLRVAEKLCMVRTETFHRGGRVVVRCVAAPEGAAHGPSATPFR